MPDLASDLRAMMAASDFGTEEPLVCQIGGQDVPCLPSRATETDALNLGDVVTIGKTRVLRIARDDAPSLDTGSPLSWNGKAWTVVQMATLAHGQLLRVFLGKAR